MSLPDLDSGLALFPTRNLYGNFLPMRRERKPSSGETPARLSALVRIDQKFLAGCALGVDRNIGGVERLLQRHDPGVMAGKGGFEFIDHALAQPFAVDRPDLHQE